VSASLLLRVDATDLPGHGEKAEIDRDLVWSEEEEDSRGKRLSHSVEFKWRTS